MLAGSQAKIALIPAGDTRLTFTSAATTGSEDADFIFTVLLDEEISGFLSFPFALFPSTKVGEGRVRRAAPGVWREELRAGQSRGAVSVPAPLGVLSEVGGSGGLTRVPPLRPLPGPSGDSLRNLWASGCVRCTGERLAFRVGLLFWRKQGGKGFQEQLLKEGRVALWKKGMVFQVSALVAIVRKVEKQPVSVLPWWSSG